jgi:hypothetical protein
MHPRIVLRVAVPVLAGAAFCAPTASAARTVVAPSPVEARTFATTNGGWTSSVDFGNLACIPGVTCPTANPSYRPTGGSAGAADGHLRDTFGTLLGVLATSTITWTSPTFEAPAGTDLARLTLSLRPQIASLLAIGSVKVTPRLVDVADPGASTTLQPRSLTAASASFAPVDFDVPTTGLVAGRTYRIAIGTSVTTNVSAVTSGNVDLDDVALTMTELAGPRNLAASVPATGPLRVAGTVDADGHDTEVVVEYGTTTSYGSTTPAVKLLGSVTGPQEFAVPLAGLEPGATYHYRVRAESTDGPATTTDATFVAPSPPTSVVPTVSGAGNARERTVRFKRAADVTEAVVEVLDENGGVRERFADGDADGAATITLPDADGAYAVRVRRTTDRGLASTSDTVPVTLDRLAPDATGVGAAVAPPVSKDRDRTVTLKRPADAATVLAQPLDASGAPVGDPVPVQGDSAAVQLGAADGTYRVRLTLTDAAGNASMATSAEVTLDTKAPEAGPAPKAKGAGNERARRILFTRDPSATEVVVELLDARGHVLDTTPVPTGDEAEVTLPDADGTYGVRVRQTDAAGNDARTGATEVVLDRVAPEAGPAPTATGAANSRLRTVAFTRDATAASVAVEILDASGALVDTVPVASGDRAEVTLPDRDGTYTVRVRQTDAAGNDARTAGVEVGLDLTAPDAGPAPTLTGSGNARERTVAFARDASATSVTVEVLDADGHVVDEIPVPSGDAAELKLPDADGAYAVRVRQQDAAGNAARTPSTEAVLDRVAPDAGPAPTAAGEPSGAEPVRVTFTRAPDATDVVVEVRDAEGTLVETVPVPTGDVASVTLPAAPGRYALRVVQTDRAGNRSVSEETTVLRAAPAPAATTTATTPAAAPATTTAPAARPAAPTQDPAAACRPATVVTGVSRSGSRIVVRGFTTRPGGTRLTIVDGKGRRVGVAVSGARGVFSARVAAQNDLRRGDVRYRATAEGRSSSSLQLDRGNALTGVRRTGRIVTLQGRVDLRRVGTVRSIVAIGGAGACPDPAGTLATIGRASVDRQGRYRLRVRADAGGRLLVRTRVLGSRAAARSAYVVR